MEEFAAGTSVSLTFDHEFNGKALTLTDFQFRVLDAQGVVLVDYDTPSDFDPAAAFTVVKVDMAYNQSSEKIDIRQVDVNLVTADGTYKTTAYYKLVGDLTKLTVMLDSFMTFPEAVMMRAKMSDRLEYYDALTDGLKATSLENTFNTIVALGFKPIGFANRHEPMYIKDYTEAQFRMLPVDFQNALKRAQLFQANALVESSPILDKIRHGVTSETIGESSMFFRAAALTTGTKYPGVADDAYNLLSPYLFSSAASSQIWRVRRS